MKDEITIASLPALAQSANDHHAAAEGAIRSALTHAVEAGKALAEAKKLVAHGGWLAWMSDNFKGSARTAQRYITISERLPELEAKTTRVSDLSLREALKMLTEPRRRPMPDEMPADEVEALVRRFIPPTGKHLFLTDGVSRVLQVSPSTSEGFYFVNWNEPDDSNDPFGQMVGTLKPLSTAYAAWQCGELDPAPDTAPTIADHALFSFGESPGRDGAWDFNAVLYDTKAQWMEARFHLKPKADQAKP